MNKSYITTLLILLFCLSATATASETRTFILDAISWKEYHFECQEGDLLSGEFQAISDGSQYPGDEQKYDDWVPVEIDFFILNESAFTLYDEGFPPPAHFIREGVSEHTWQFRVPTEGTWYVIYYNDSIYLVTIEDSIHHSEATELETTLTTVLLTGLVVFLSILYYHRMRK